jgi:HSP20 family protein
MHLVRWNPYAEMTGLRHRFNRLFDPSLPSLWDREADVAAGWRPAVDVYEENEAYVIKAELPGVDKKDISVDLKGRTLVITGERAAESEVKQGHYHRRERTFGKFQRAFRLPEALDADKITADFKDGVLRITVPKREEVKPKQVTVH